MKLIRSILAVILVMEGATGSAQVLSNLHATKSDALFTTYAAAPPRSHYKTDQGYQFQWFDDECGVEFISQNGPNFGVAFQHNNRLIFKLQELFQEPVITTSYSDLVKYYYYPFKGLRVEVFFSVYSSETAIFQCNMINESKFPIEYAALPYFYYPSADSTLTLDHLSLTEGYHFKLEKKLDGWMTEHNIPLEESFNGLWTINGFRAFSDRSFVVKTAPGNLRADLEPMASLFSSMNLKKRTGKYLHGLIQTRNFTLQPGDRTSFTIEISLAGTNEPTRKQLRKTDNIDFEQILKESEQVYAKIPRLQFADKDKELLYWSAFSLMRQCMMPPEGECRHNYYVFSREPKWGWGYGGQVFHESLTMLAYAYMDPKGAMNSQRIFMDRQRDDGYINYRTGPYLNETIETNGKPTSSAPWFNYVNNEVYKITGDRTFLSEAYISGRKFYRYYTASRDSNSNGLCEWGAHAELESVRDARVAVWDKVGWASNFEGPDINSMLVMEAKSLAEMASELGLTEEANQWLEDATHRSTLINNSMWDKETGFYYNVSKEDHSFSFHSQNDLKVKEIIGFLPLWAGVTDPSVAKILVEKMQDTIEFWRPYGIPSLTAVQLSPETNGYYCPIGYWNGPVWIQWNYMLYRGLRDYGYHLVANQLSSRVLSNMIFHLKKDHVFWEFYSADDHQAGWNKTYIWAGIATRFLIDSTPQH
ncbi:MAG: MGH1-like glycoside hydrolase domain-containing protein [Bacteroidales bacterium]